MKHRAILSLIMTSALMIACSISGDTQQGFPVAADDPDAMQYRISEISAGASDVPDQYRHDLREYLEKDLKKRGMLASDSASRQVEITITEFAMSNGASRVLHGELVGMDVVRTHINIVDTTTNESIGYSSIELQGTLEGGGSTLFISNHAKAISNFLHSKN